MLGCTSRSASQGIYKWIMGHGGLRSMDACGGCMRRHVAAACGGGGVLQQRRAAARWTAAASCYSSSVRRQRAVAACSGNVQRRCKVEEKQRRLV